MFSFLTSTLAIIHVNVLSNTLTSWFLDHFLYSCDLNFQTASSEIPLSLGRSSFFSSWTSRVLTLITTTVPFSYFPISHPIWVIYTIGVTSDLLTPSIFLSPISFPLKPWSGLICFPFWPYTLIGCWFQCYFSRINKLHIIASSSCQYLQLCVSFAFLSKVLIMSGSHETMLSESEFSLISNGFSLLLWNTRFLSWYSLSFLIVLFSPFHSP